MYLLQEQVLVNESTCRRALPTVQGCHSPVKEMGYSWSAATGLHRVHIQCMHTQAMYLPTLLDVHVSYEGRFTCTQISKMTIFFHYRIIYYVHLCKNLLVL